ncbi:hypothetical protein [Paenibacillus sp. ATY16]|uniref:hypothetical protein n=1 Tax=Paenibacillus sp. ATY16 TaxID=1759312 RepID=UPI00200BB6A3|nr:hypothetical protein [Paenibacillus sp. ATY16]MCK9858270.1 hypothetical protein [Paenibacillus sp. ATY16]
MERRLRKGDSVYRIIKSQWSSIWNTLEKISLYGKLLKLVSIHLQHVVRIRCRLLTL